MITELKGDVKDTESGIKGGGNIVSR